MIVSLYWECFLKIESTKPLPKHLHFSNAPLPWQVVKVWVMEVMRPWPRSYHKLCPFPSSGGEHVVGNSCTVEMEHEPFRRCVSFSNEGFSHLRQIKTRDINGKAKEEFKRQNH